MLNLKNIYFIVFLSLSAWILFAYFTTTEIIHKQKAYAHIINISGKQRMLSQKTALMAKRFYESSDETLKVHLQDLYNLMQGDYKTIIEHPLCKKDGDSLHFTQSAELKKMADAYLKLLDDFMESPSLSLLKKIEEHSFVLLPLFDSLVYAFEAQSNAHVEKLMKRELFILLGTLLTLFLEAVFIVLPSIKTSTKKEEVFRALLHERTKELKRLSQIDQLTQLYNRRKIDEILSDEIAQTQRYETALSMIIVDIDHFKQVNDTYGHQIGDKTLQEMAQLLHSHIRKTDMVGRWGGEEFLIIIRENDQHKVIQYVEKLRKRIEDHDFVTAGHLTCSFGVSHYIEGDTAVSLLSRADKALYQAKAAGRNCIREIL